MESIIVASAVVGCIVYLIAAVEYSLLLRRSGVVFLPAFLFSAIWSMTAWQTIAIDFLYAFIWSSTLIWLIIRRNQIQPYTFYWYLVWATPVMALIGCGITIFLLQKPTQFGFYLYLLCCIGTLLISEQHIRNSDGLSKTVGIGIGTLFLFNLYLYSNALMVGYVSFENAQVRGLVSTTVGIMLCLAPLFVSPVEYQRMKLELSRPLVFTTTSLILAGLTLLFVSLLGYLFSIDNGEFASVIRPFFFFLGVLLVGLYMASPIRRSRLRVWIFRNFFNTKYDYNDEWRRLNETLSPDSSNGDYIATAMRAILPIFDGLGGSCYINKGGRFTPEGKINIAVDLKPVLQAAHPQFFAKMLDADWIYVPPATESALANFNELIPPELREIESTLFILPLINHEELIGFITVSTSLERVETFNWEDLDLLRMVGKQISNFVGNHLLSAQIVVTRQFEAYHQFTTFVMHDLKNLIAQQALVVENAKRFSHNPEFVADAVKTIENSVKKMNRLLLRINQNSAIDLEQIQRQQVNIVDCLRSALVKCSGRQPEPTLQSSDDDLMVDADPYSLTMAFTHMLTNAQEACTADGKIDISVSRQGNYAQCRITDTGVGMEQDFIDNRLFKPFDSTKKNQGMGIGAYQYKQIVSNIGGTISVTSQIGEGSCFTITLPLSV